MVALSLWYVEGRQDYAEGIFKGHIIGHETDRCMYEDGWLDAAQADNVDKLIDVIYKEIP